MSSSKTATVFPISAALCEALRFSNVSQDSWRTRNDTQAKFLHAVHMPVRDQLSKLSPEELKFLASKNVDEINAWLAENGFDIKLDPFEDPKDFGVASIQDITVQWIEAGSKVEIPDAHNRSLHKGVSLKTNVQFYQNSSHDHPIASITTQNGDVVKMTVAGGDYVDPLRMLVDVKVLDRILDRARFDRVEFPCVDLEDKPDVKFLIGMNFIDNDGDEMRIAQAVQQTFFKMNENGARVKSGFAMGVVRTSSIRMPEPPMVINEPFLLWITRPGTDTPYFAAYIDRDSFKDPGSLVMKGDK